MSDGSGSSDDDGEYTLENAATDSSTRYPVHDCCEFEDAETLRVSKGLMVHIQGGLLTLLARGPQTAQNCRNILSCWLVNKLL
jgi:hypothetical protein